MSSIDKDDDSIIKDLLETNIRQRGDVGNANPIKSGRCFQFLNAWYGFEHGGDRKSSENNFNLKSNNEIKAQKDLSETYGVTQQTMNNYMRLTKAIPELEELVDTGIVTPTTALAIMRNLSEEEQFRMIANSP